MVPSSMNSTPLPSEAPFPRAVRSHDDHDGHNDLDGLDGLDEILDARERDLEEQLASIRAESLSVAGGIGFGKRIGEGTNIAVERLVEVAKHDRLLAELDKVRRAKERRAEGETRHCENCGDVIPDERLEALPWALRCVRCADL